MAAPILNLDSLVDRPTVVINGQEYELLTTDILPPLDLHRFSRYSTRIGVLMAKVDLTAEDEAELDDLPRRMCRMVLEAPDGIHDALTQKQRMKIVESFIAPLQPDRHLESGRVPATPTSPSTGANGSRDSSPSTVATP